MTFPYAELTDLVTIAKGHKAPVVSSVQSDGAKRYIQIADLHGSSEIGFALDPKGLLATQSDVIIAWDGANAGTVGFGLEGYIGSTLAILRPKRENFLPEYLGRFLQSQFKNLNQNTTGATIPHLDRQRLSNLPIPLPPLPEQRRIAAILDKADAIRRKRKEALELCDQFLQSVFLDMFGDPVKNPKGWEIGELGKISQIQGGLQVTFKRECNPLDVPYLRVANVYRDKLQLTEIKTIRVTQEELRRTKLEKGDILVVEGHGNKEEIGRAAVWDGSLSECVHQNHLIRVRINKDIVAPEFVSCYLNSSGGRLQMFQASRTTSGLNTISTRIVASINVFLPPIHIQKKFSQILEKEELLKSRLQSSLQESESLFHSLVQKAFRGELNRA